MFSIPTMHIGYCHISIRIPESHSLKEKRVVVRFITSRLCREFNVSVAEVEHNDLWQLVTLGVCCVSNNPRHANEILSKIIDYLNTLHGDWELLEYDIEVMSGL